MIIFTVTYISGDGECLPFVKAFCNYDAARVAVQEAYEQIWETGHSETENGDVDRAPDLDEDGGYDIDGKRLWEYRRPDSDIALWIISEATLEL